MNYYKDSAGLTDDHLKAIGLVAVNWGHIENILSQIIWNIAKLRTTRGMAITSHLSERARAEVKIGPRESFSPEDIMNIAEEIEVAALNLEIIKNKISQLLPTLSGWP